MSDDYFFVKTGNQFGIEGWWINVNLTAPFSDHCHYVSDPEEGVGGENDIWVYFGMSKPADDQIQKFIKIIPPDF